MVAKYYALVDKLNTVTEKVPEAAETKVVAEINEKKESEKEKEKVMTDEEKKTMEKEKEKVDETKMTDEQPKEQPIVTPSQPVVAM